MATQLDFNELQSLAAEILGIEPDEVQLDKSFQRDLAADSLDLVELIAAIEDKHDVELSEEELEKMKVIGDLWKFLEQKTAERLEAYSRWRLPTSIERVPTPFPCVRSNPKAGRAPSPGWASTRRTRSSRTSTSRR